MVTGHEMRAYADLSEIRRQTVHIADLLARIAGAMEKMVETIEASSVAMGELVEAHDEEG